MGFDIQKFKAADIGRAEAELAVPELAEWFDEGEDAVFRLRSLTASELYRAADAVSSYEAKSAFLHRLAKGTAKEKAEAAAQILGIGDSESSEYVRRIVYLQHGCESPELDEEAIKRIAKYYPATFIAVAMKIEALSNQGGASKKKPKSSGSGKKSKPA